MVVQMLSARQFIIWRIILIVMLSLLRTSCGSSNPSKVEVPASGITIVPNNADAAGGVDVSLVILHGANCQVTQYEQLARVIQAYLQDTPVRLWIGLPRLVMVSHKRLRLSFNHHN